LEALTAEKGQQLLQFFKGYLSIDESQTNTDWLFKKVETSNDKISFISLQLSFSEPLVPLNIDDNNLDSMFVPRNQTKTSIESLENYNKCLQN